MLLRLSEPTEVTYHSNGRNMTLEVDLVECPKEPTRCGEVQVLAFSGTKQIELQRIEDRIQQPHLQDLSIINYRKNSRHRSRST